MKRRFAISTSFLIAGIALTGCRSYNDTTNHAQDTERHAIGTQQDTYNRVQPVPIFTGPSQQRETGFTVQRAQVEGPATTSFVTKNGNLDPIFVCSSIGYPFAASTEATNPQTLVSASAHTDVPIAAMDPNGTYPVGTTSGTYVGCLQKTGRIRIDYFEDNVDVVGASATWDYTKHQIIVTGDATVSATRVKK